MVTHVKELKKAFLIVVSVDLAIFRRNSVISSMINVHGADYLNDMDFILDSSPIYYIVLRCCNLWVIYAISGQGNVWLDL